MRIDATVATPERVAFGLPLPHARVKHVRDLAIFIGGRRVPACVTPLLTDFASGPVPIGVRAVLIELDRFTPVPAAVEVRFSGGALEANHLECTHRPFDRDAHAVDVAIEGSVCRASVWNHTVKPRIIRH